MCIRDSPSTVYTETQNQSLLAAILRLSHWNLAAATPTHDVLFVALAATLAIVSCIFVAQLPHDRDDWAIVLVMLFALLVYPVSLWFYSELLIVPALLLWSQRATTLGTWPMIIFITSEFILMDYHNGAFTVIATALNWLAFAGLSVASIRQIGRSPSLGGSTVNA